MMIDIHSMNDGELENTFRLICAERQARFNKRQEEAWSKVRNAIYDYISEYGEIEIREDDDTFYLSNNMDFQTIGEIREKF